MCHTHPILFSSPPSFMISLICFALSISLSEWQRLGTLNGQNNSLYVIFFPACEPCKSFYKRCSVCVCVRAHVCDLDISTSGYPRHSICSPARHGCLWGDERSSNTYRWMNFMHTHIDKCILYTCIRTKSPMLLNISILLHF